jgi:hypothetical protein
MHDEAQLTGCTEVQGLDALAFLWHMKLYGSVVKTWSDQPSTTGMNTEAAPSADMWSLVHECWHDTWAHLEGLQSWDVKKGFYHINN